MTTTASAYHISFAFPLIRSVNEFLDRTFFGIRIHFICANKFVLCVNGTEIFRYVCIKQIKTPPKFNFYTSTEIVTLSSIQKKIQYHATKCMLFPICLSHCLALSFTFFSITDMNWLHTNTHAIRITRTSLEMWIHSKNANVSMLCKKLR